MKKTSRQLVLGSLQPLLFIVGMYFVVLIFSVFVCSSIYKVTHGSTRGALTIQKTHDRQLAGGTTAMVTAFK